jgi:hypothetical protein
MLKEYLAFMLYKTCDETDNARYKCYKYVKNILSGDKWPFKTQSFTNLLNQVWHYSS